MQLFPKITRVALNNNAGNYVVIQLSIFASKVKVQEDPTLNAGVFQGLQGFRLDPATATVVNQNVDPNIPGQMVWLSNSAGQIGPAYQPIIFGGEEARVHGGEGQYVGAGGTCILMLRSNSANPTGVLIEEWG